MRWCTKNLKIKPLEEWIGDDQAISYVAIRADEHRLGYVQHQAEHYRRVPLPRGRS